MDVLLENETDGLTDNPKPRLTLRDAVRLCGMSEKTLRRKLEAGLLHGYRENLDYGGFMWMIDAKSLSDLYPDSAQLRDYIRLLESQLNQRPQSPFEPSQAESAPTLVPEEALRKGEQQEAPPEASEAKKNRSGNDFVIYLLEENRCLKEDVREKEIRLRQLQDRTMMLERECGEQRGTASTQARVLEWFQRQPGQAAAPRGGQLALPTPPTDYRTTTSVRESPISEAVLVTPNKRPILIGALGALACTWAILGLMHLFAH
jgi:hypothetical protein